MSFCIYTRNKLLRLLYFALPGQGLLGLLLRFRMICRILFVELGSNLLLLGFELVALLYSIRISRCLETLDGLREILCRRGLAACLRGTGKGPP